MIDQDFTIQTYMQEIKPIIDEVQAKDVTIRRFEMSLTELREETLRCDDNLTIYLCWQDMIGRQLHQQYNESQLLDLHGYQNGTLVHTDTFYSIITEDEHIVDFHFCEHRIYTPVTNATTNHHCLKC